MFAPPFIPNLGVTAIGVLSVGVEEVPIGRSCAFTDTAATNISDTKLIFFIK
jgi:hypothetical protein